MSLMPARRAVTLAGLSVALFSVLSGIGAAQAVRSGGTPPPDPSRFELYGGYGYYHPVNSDIDNYFYQPVNPGAVASVTGYFNHRYGVQAEGSYFPNGSKCVYTAQAGPVVRFEKNRWVPFAHVLGGGAKIGGPVSQPCTWGWGLTGGVGLDYILPILNNRIALRPIQADFSYSHVNYGVSPYTTQGGVGKPEAFRLSAGVVLRFGANATPNAIQLGCSAQPVDIFPGDPVNVTATTGSLDLRRKTTYTWASTGGKITGNETTASVNTSGLAAGDYTVTGHVAEGLLPSQQADCNTSFRVHAYEAPTIACSASPATVTTGESATITTTAHSPQGRPLTYSYSVSAGQISGSTETATLATAGVTAGSTVTVTCNIVDDLGQQATANTSVGISVPPAPPAPQVQPLCLVAFDRDRKRPVRVDNEAKGCLDDIGLTLNRETAAKLVLVGDHDEKEQPNAAAERTLNVEQYLIDEKGVDPSRIELRTGDTTGRAVQTFLVPAGASFDAGSTATFDRNSVQRHGQAYGKIKPKQTTR